MYSIKKNVFEIEDEEETVDSENEQKPFRYFEQPATVKLHHVYISDSIGEPKDYIDLIHKIKFAGPNDIVNIYLNTPGGYLTTGAQIINAIRASSAHVVTHVEGEVCSLGTLIFLSGDEMVVHDGSLFMIHTYSGVSSGKGHEMHAQTKAQAKWFEEIARRSYIGFLTEEEFEEMIAGRDLWFTAEQVRARLNRYVKHLNKQAKDEQAKAEAKEKARAKKAKEAKEAATKQTEDNKDAEIPSEQTGDDS